MGFECEFHTRERLEWSRLLEHLASHAATERGAAACREERFAPDAVAIRQRLAETSEARALMDAGEAVPFGGVSDLRPLLHGLARGRTPEARELIDVLECARAARRVRRFLAERRQQVPGLAALAETMAELRPLEERLESALTPEAEVRDAASVVLASARREARRLEGEIERRMAGYLRDPHVEPHLQDNYSTFREGRPVLPIRADARRRVPGILHDVSSSGTTLFIEPEGVVEAGNRLRLARTEERHEVERVLGRLGEAVAAESLELEAQGGTLCLLDWAVARGRLSQRLDATAPEVDDSAPLALRALRHPLLALEGGLEPDRVVANDLELPEHVRGLVISGPNAGGKTVLAKALGLAALAIRAGLHVACAAGSRMPAFEAVFADIGDEQDLRAGLSTFSGRMAQLARILDRADSHTLVILDEVGEGTEPGEGGGGWVQCNRSKTTETGDALASRGDSSAWDYRPVFGAGAERHEPRRRVREHQRLSPP